MRISGIPEEVLHQHIIALGKTGSGKSSKLRVLVEHLLSQELPVCIIDPKGDWWGLKLSADGKKAGYPIVIFGGEHADVPINQQAGKHVAEIVATGNRPCIIDMGEMMVGERTKFFIDFASTLFRRTKGLRHLVIDEVHNFAPKGQQLRGDTPMMLHWANRLASEGRGKGIRLIAASQRSQKVHNDFLTSCETLIAGRVIHKADRDAIKNWVDGCADQEKGRHVLSTLATMKRTEAWVWSPEIDFGPNRIQFEFFKTYDSFKPQSQEEFEKLQGWANVNLDDIKQKFSGLIEEAKSNDPKELKLRVAELEKKLRKHKNCILPAEHLRQLNAGIKKAIANFPSSASAPIEEMRAAMLSIGRICVQYSTPGKKPINGTEPALKPIAQSPNGDLSGPQQRILNSLAWWENTGMDAPYSKVRVAFIADYSPKGSAFTNPLSALKTAELIEYPQPKMLALTDEGRELAKYPVCVATNKELHEAILNRLSGPQRKILTQVIDVYPTEISKPNLADRSDYSPKGSAFTNPLSSLRSLGLIAYPRPGHVIACSDLFLDK